MQPEKHFRLLEHMYEQAPINEYYRPRLSISSGEAELIIPIRKDFFHAANAVHGSVYFKALDDAAFFAVNSLVTDVFVLTVSFNIFLTRPVSSGDIKAVGKVVHQSRQLFVAESVLSDDAGRQIGRGSGTFIRSKIKLNAAVGYVP